MIPWEETDLNDATHVGSHGSFTFSLIRGQLLNPVIALVLSIQKLLASNQVQEWLLIKAGVSEIGRSLKNWSRALYKRYREGNDLTQKINVLIVKNTKTFLFSVSNIYIELYIKYSIIKMHHV